MGFSGHAEDKQDLIDKARAFYRQIHYNPLDARQYVEDIRRLLTEAGVEARVLELSSLRSSEEINVDLDEAAKRSDRYHSIKIAQDTYRQLQRGDGDPSQLVPRIRKMISLAQTNISILDPTGARDAREIEQELERWLTLGHISGTRTR